MLQNCNVFPKNKKYPETYDEIFTMFSNNKKDDIDFTYVFAKDIKKSIFCYIVIFFFIVQNILCRCLNKFVLKYNN